MNIDLKGKNALVGGASRGIGRACALALAELGASVTLFSRSADLMSELVGILPKSEGQSHDFQVVDYTDPSALQKTTHILSKTKSYHILINNTGGPKGGAILDAKAEEFESAFRKHIVAAQILSQILIPGMKKSGYGRIVNIISTSVKAPIPNLGVSNTIRAAMANWAKTLAMEVGPDSITVNNVLPGFTDTQRLHSIIRSRSEKSGKSLEEVSEGMKAKVPMNRFADPSETASAVAFLASPAAAYITGTNLPVDGGRTKSL